MDLKRALTAYDRVESATQDFGASDTEPRQVYEQLIADAIAGKRLDFDDLLEYTPDHWQLYSSLPGVNRAASRLSRAAIHVLKALQCVTVSELPGALKTLSEHVRYTTIT